jgi:hypothetical protein
MKRINKRNRFKPVHSLVSPVAEKVRRRVPRIRRRFPRVPTRWSLSRLKRARPAEARR